MKKMEVKLISKEIIKPSSSTPAHLQTLKISLLDQIGGLTRVSCISYYPKKKEDANFMVDDDKLINQLKESLSETLARFYPLAGRVKDPLTIDCNDEGIIFSIARVNCHMAELLSAQPPDLQTLPMLIPYYVYLDPSDSVVQVAVQLNIFGCGGVAISGCFMHKIIDAATISAFLKCWASNSIARSRLSGGSNHSPPTTTGSSSSSEAEAEAIIYPGASLFPAKQSLPADLLSLTERSLLREGNGITQRFLFTSEAISALKAKATSERVPNPTRVEAISGFIWKHAMAASRAVWGVHQPSILSQQMDLRRRISVPSLMSKYSVGNFLWKTVAHCDEVAGGGGEEGMAASLDGLVGSLRAAIERTRDDVLPKLLQGQDGGYGAYVKFYQDLTETCQSNKNLNPYMFSSWCKLGFNEVDFGWGNPVWISSVGARVNSIHKNTALLMEAGLDDRIEAWLTLDEREMDVLERDQEFLKFASLNPSIILS